jgi:Fe-S cluster biogenesis protein NfuA
VDVVTVAATENVVNVVAVTDRHKPMAGPFLLQFGRLMQAIGTNIFFSHGSPVIIVTPGQAARLEEEGYGRQRLQRELFERAKVPLADMPFGNYTTARWKVVDDHILPCPTADDIRILVSGGSESLHSVYMQSFWSSSACSAQVWRPDHLGGASARTVGALRPAAVEAALDRLRPGLASDGFELTVGALEPSGVVKVVLRACEDACLDCLVAESVMVRMIEDSIRRENQPVDHVVLVTVGFDRTRTASR